MKFFFYIRLFLIRFQHDKSGLDNNGPFNDYKKAGLFLAAVTKSKSKNNFCK